MKAHTTNFKNVVKGLGRELDVKTTHNSGVLDMETLNAVKPRFNTELFKTTMKVLEFDSSVKTEAKQWVNLEIGLKVGSAFEYLDYGNYYINEEPEYSVDNKSYIYKAYDKMIESMISYDKHPLAIIYPITYKNLLIAICDALNWDYELPTLFPNMNTEINRDIYVGLGLTYRDVLDDLAPASMGNFINDGTFKIQYPNDTGDTIDGEFLNQDNITIEKKVGPINALVLARADGGDTINRRDETSIIENGLNEIKISDNLLLSVEYREDFIQEMFDYIKDFEYYSFDVSSKGVLYYEVLDMFTINHDSKNYKVLLLNDELEIEGGITEQMFAPSIIDEPTDYSTSSKTDKATKMATIIAYKNEARIETITQELNDNSSKITAVEQTVEGVTTKIEEIDEIEERTTTIEENIDGLQVGISSIGGTNLVKNSVGHYQDNWENKHNGFTNTEIKNNTVSGHCFFIGDKSSNQVIQVQNGTYTIGFKYKKLLELAEVKIKVNDHEIELTETDWTNGNYTFEVLSNAITIELIGDNDNSCYLSDLMGNRGIVAHVWSSASGESINGGVKIGSSIEIESSVSNIKQIMDNDGNRIKNISTDETVAEFTDKGIVTKEIKTNSAAIARVIIQNVGNQTWFTRV